MKYAIVMIKIKMTPKLPGVYFFKDFRGKVIYVGKAANLKNRLSSYFDKREKVLKVQQMLDRAARVDWQETDSEIEALILESQLIKKRRPEFNVLMRDDKQYFYIVITKEIFPKIIITHRPKIISNKQQAVSSKIVGPFTDGGALKTTLRFLRKIFPYCSCEQKHNNHCLNYHIGNCLGFCCLKRDANKNQIKIYKKNTAAIMEILKGQKKSFVKKLEKEMKDAAAKHDFARAAEIRNRVIGLEKVFENAKVISDISKRDQSLKDLQKFLKLEEAPARIEAYDISNIQGKFAVGSMVVFGNGRPDKSEYKKFRIKTFGRSDDTGMIKEVLARRLKHNEWQYPHLILIDGGKGQLNAALDVLEEFGLKIPVISLTKDSRHRGHHVFSGSKKPIQLSEIPEPVKDLILQIDAEAHRFAISYYRKLHNQSVKIR